MQLQLTFHKINLIKRCKILPDFRNPAYQTAGYPIHLKWLFYRYGFIFLDCLEGKNYNEYTVPVTFEWNSVYSENRFIFNQKINRFSEQK